LSSRVKKEPKAKPKKPAEKVAPVRPREEAVAPKKVAEVPRPKGAKPRAMVFSRHEGAMIEREARGYSMGELSSAGFDLRAASRLGLATDTRRRTVLERNVESLKGWFVPPKQAPVQEPAMRETAPEPAPKPKKRAPAKKTTK
jgi:ribosomal protein L13E